MTPDNKHIDVIHLLCAQTYDFEDLVEGWRRKQPFEVTLELERARELLAGLYDCIGDLTVELRVLQRERPLDVVRGTSRLGAEGAR